MSESRLVASDFFVALEAPSHVPRYVDCPEPSKYSDDLDDVRSVLADLCDVLAEVEGVRFVARGFDQVPWRATVRTDLAVALEQVPDVLTRLKAEQSVELDFFEQGLERTVRFSGTGPDVTVICASRQLTWRPQLEAITMNRQVVVDMLQQLGDTFLRVAADACPRLVKHRWIARWAAAIHQ